MQGMCCSAKREDRCCSTQQSVAAATTPHCCGTCRLLGKPREAARLSAGWTAFCIINKTEIDTGPIFTSYQLLALEAAVDRSDLHTFLLVRTRLILVCHATLCVGSRPSPCACWIAV
jgi:hypothetical protein